MNFFIVMVLMNKYVCLLLELGEEVSFEHKLEIMSAGHVLSYSVSFLTPTASGSDPAGAGNQRI